MWQIQRLSSFSVNIEDIRIFIRFLIFDDDLGVQIVKNSMSRKAYLELKSLLHFAWDLGMSYVWWYWILYCGKEKSEDHTTDNFGTKVVKKMLSVVQDPHSYCVYFDNFFYNNALIYTLKELGIRATGTKRENLTQYNQRRNWKKLPREHLIIDLMK